MTKGPHQVASIRKRALYLTLLCTGIYVFAATNAFLLGPAWGSGLIPWSIGLWSVVWRSVLFAVLIFGDMYAIFLPRVISASDTRCLRGIDLLLIAVGFAAILLYIRVSLAF